MKKTYFIWAIATFCIILLLGAFFLAANLDEAETYEKPILETVSVNISYQLQNNIGRTLSNVNVKTYLPMFAMQHDDMEGVTLTSGNDALFYEFQIEEIKPDQKIEFQNDYLVNLTEAVEDLASAVIYQKNLSNEERLTFLDAELQKSNDANEFILAHPQVDSLLFLASTLSKSKSIRIVSGVDKSVVDEQKVKCWLQEYRDDRWQTIGSDKEILPFKIMPANEQITEATCENALVEAWALDADNYKITLKTKTEI